ncbi:MAG TPA: hypothetical protein DCS93_33460 [Microscillaceae bacterium]|nr:hypothetical protein [Microscillaceae bacterium]
MRNLAKSIFISTLPVYGLVAGIYALTQVINEFSLPWLGAALGALTIGIFFAVILAFRPIARTKPNAPELTLLITITAVFALVTAFVNKPLQITPMVLALVNGVGWLVYIFWYSSFGDRSNNEFLQVGQQLPIFELENEKGEKISSKTYEGSTTLWMFYRGNWCPLCMAQIREIAKQYQEMAKRGVKVALISPQPHGHTRQLAQKMQVPFDFLVDVKNQAAKQLNILAENGLPKGMEVLGYDSDTVMPTVLMTNAQGKIIFADLTDNYRVRPEPATFLKVLDEQVAVA